MPPEDRGGLLAACSKRSRRMVWRQEYDTIRREFPDFLVIVNPPLRPGSGGVTVVLRRRLVEQDGWELGDRATGRSSRRRASLATSGPPPRSRAVGRPRRRMSWSCQSMSRRAGVLLGGRMPRLPSWVASALSPPPLIWSIFISRLMCSTQSLTGECRLTTPRSCCHTGICGAGTPVAEEVAAQYDKQRDDDADFKEAIHRATRTVRHRLLNRPSATSVARLALALLPWRLGTRSEWRAARHERHLATTTWVVGQACRGRADAAAAVGDPASGQGGEGALRARARRARRTAPRPTSGLPAVAWVSVLRSTRCRSQLGGTRCMRVSRGVGAPVGAGVREDEGRAADTWRLDSS